MKTKEEIKALIATAIAGKGNQVDSGGKLAEILDEIVDMAGQGSAGGYLAVSNSPTENVRGTKADIAAAWGTTEAEIDNIMASKYNAIYCEIEQLTYYPKFFTPLSTYLVLEDGTSAYYIRSDGAVWETGPDME